MHSPNIAATPSLPTGTSALVDAGKLSQIFDDTTNSYKFFFFLSLLDLVQELPTSKVSDTPLPAQAIPLYKILWHMLELSYAPVLEFHIRLPYQDRLPSLLKELNQQLTADGLPLTNAKRETALSYLGQMICQDLTCPPKQRNTEWPSLALNMLTATASNTDKVTTLVQIKLSDFANTSLGDSAALSMLQSATAVKVGASTGAPVRKIKIEGSASELEQYDWISQLAQFLESESGHPHHSFGGAKHLLAGSDKINEADILKLCTQWGLKATLTQTSVSTEQDSLVSPPLSDLAGMTYPDFLQEFASLEKYVPFRLLKPWIGGQDGLAKITSQGQLSSEEAWSLPYFLGQLPAEQLAPYQTAASAAAGAANTALSQKSGIKAVVINPHWLSYLQQHEDILRSFAYHKLAMRLESLNPLMPALQAKLLPQSKRSQLKKQHDYFRSYLTQAKLDQSLVPLQDIYTQQTLTSESDFALDHFLPWSFVHHDLIWNLTPIDHLLNSAKSNLLPNSKFILGLAEQQRTLLRYHVHQAQSELQQQASSDKGRSNSGNASRNYLGKFNVFVNDFLQMGQGCSVTELSECSSDDFYDLLAAQLKPALQIAESQGFSKWEWR